MAVQKKSFDTFKLQFWMQIDNSYSYGDHCKHLLLKVPQHLICKFENISFDLWRYILTMAKYL